MIVAAPIIGSNPSAGFLIGAAAQNRRTLLGRALSTPILRKRTAWVTH
jgi:hypothetical protein